MISIVQLKINIYLKRKSIFRISKNTKELVKLFDNNPSHESYIKSNKIDLSKENDLIKFVKFANEQ